MNKYDKGLLYILSLSLFFLCVLILNLNIPEQSDFFIINTLKNNICSAICAFLLLCCVGIYYRFVYFIVGTGGLSIKITHVKSKTADQLDFLTTSILPLIAFNLGGYKSYIVISIILISMGFIYIKTEKYCQSPILSILGFNLYSVTYTINGNDIKANVLSLKNITTGTSVRWVRLSENVIFVR